MKRITEINTKNISATLYELTPEHDDVDEKRYYATSDIRIEVQEDVSSIFQASFVDYDTTPEHTLIRACESHIGKLESIVAKTMSDAREALKDEESALAAYDPMEAYYEYLDTLEHHGTWINNKGD